MWRFIEVISLLALVTIVCLSFVKLLPYILPFVIGAFFAVLLLPVVRTLEKRGFSRLTSVLTVMLSVVVLLIGLSTYLIIAVAREAVMWTQMIPQYFTQVQEWVTDRIILGKNLFGQLPGTVTSQMESSLAGLVSTVERILTGSVGEVIKSLTQLPESMFVVAVALIATFFMLVNRARMYEKFLGTLPPGWSAKIRVVTDDVMRAFAGTIRVQVVLMLMSAVLGVIGMLIFGIQYAVILGILFGITGIIPILGSAILTIPWAAGALLIGDFPLALKIIIIQLGISLIRHLVEPKILADSVGLDTLSTLFALYAGMKLIGVVGLFLGPIVLIGVKSLLQIRLLVDFFPTTESALEPSTVKREVDVGTDAHSQDSHASSEQPPDTTNGDKQGMLS
jgi:sporulation integral membrane protein YtvI